MHTGQHACEGPVEERTFSCTRQAVGLARRWASEVYAEVGGDPEACALAVSEVVTNAVVHTGSSRFGVRIERDSLRIHVWDESPALPRRRQVDDESEGGRGLEILDMLAPGYEVHRWPPGKCVCFQPKGW